MAHTIGEAWSLDVEASSIGGRCRRTGPHQRRLDSLCHLVQADDEDYLCRTPGDGSHAVAIAVDIDNDAILRDGIGAAQIVVGTEGAAIHRQSFFGRRSRVAVYHIEGGATLEAFGDAEVTDGHGAAPRHTAPIVDESRHLLDGLVGGGAIVCCDVAALELADDGVGQSAVALFLRSHGLVWLDDGDVESIAHGMDGIEWTYRVDGPRYAMAKIHIFLGYGHGRGDKNEI